MTAKKKNKPIEKEIVNQPPESPKRVTKVLSVSNAKQQPSTSEEQVADNKAAPQTPVVKEAETKEETSPIKLATTDLPIDRDLTKPMPEDEVLIAKKPKLSILKIMGIIGGGVLIILSILCFIVYMHNIHNFIAGIGGFALLGGGGILIYLMFQRGGGVFSSGGSVSKRATLGEVNSLVIGRDLISFEEVKREKAPNWQARKCRNNGKMYWVYKETVNKDNTKMLDRFVLPDTIYRDPREVANYLNIPAHRRLAQREANLFQKIAPGLICVGMLIVGIIWIASSPTPQPTVAASNSSINNSISSSSSDNGGFLVGTQAPTTPLATPITTKTTTETTTVKPKTTVTTMSTVTTPTVKMSTSTLTTTVSGNTTITTTTGGK